MLFLGMANAYVMRTNMSVAIVAMVNHTALPRSPDVVDDECFTDGSMSVTNQVRNYPTGVFSLSYQLLLFLRVSLIFWKFFCFVFV